MILREIKIGVLFLIIFTIVLGVIYPLFMTAVGKIFFQEQASGSLIIQNQQVVGSTLIGQLFTDEKYFHGRPSANNYNALYSGGTNSSVVDMKYINTIKNRIQQLQKENQSMQKVPVDLVESSGSGLDPEISVMAAEYQINRIAKARHLAPSKIQHLIDHYTIKPVLGVFGESRVNVLELNLALDKEAVYG